MWVVFVFFLFKQKTAYEMRISDWSSDVCSSDLPFGNSGLVSVPASGALAGLADAYVQLSDSASALDTLANQFVTTVNAVHRQGVDLNGQPGADLFATSSLAATPSRTNVGQATLRMEVTDQTQVFPGGYELRYDRSEEHTSELQSLMRS